MTYILNACALIALFKKEQGADKVRALLDDAIAGQSVVYMHTVNLIEVHLLQPIILILIKLKE